MNKSDLIEIIAKQSEIPKSAAGRALKAMTVGVTSTLKKGGTVSIPGLGTFSVSARTGSPGVGRLAGATSKTRVARVATFRPSKALKDAL